MYTVEQKFQIAQLWYQTKSPALVRHRSVAKLRGGGGRLESPYWPKKYAKY